jgi:hypothetical protein
MGIVLKILAKETPSLYATKSFTLGKSRESLMINWKLSKFKFSES